MERLLLAGLALALLTSAATAKNSRTFYSEEMMARVRQKLATEEWAQAEAASARRAVQWLLDMSDQEVWDFIPPPEQLRAINVCIGHDCPVCGDEITRKAGHYPWITSREKPFKLECPVCHSVFPSNDFEPWNTEGLEGEPDDTLGYVDNGLGWLDKRDGRRYYFVPYYIFWQRWSRDIIGGVRDLAKAYLLTEDPACAHKAAVMLAKIASEYRRFDYATQCYHEGRFGVGGRISDYIWTTGNDSTLGLAADAIWPALSQDRELTAFLATKGIVDAARTIEQDMLFVMVDDLMTGKAAGNMGMHQSTLCELAIVLDNDDPAAGPTTADIRQWLMSGPGRVEDLLWNGFWREGLGGEASPGYSSGWCSNFYEIARLLPRIGVDIWSNPKLKKMADIGYDLCFAGEYTPCVGDAGSCLGMGRVAWTPGLQGPAFMHYRDPRHAQMLALMGAKSQSLFDELFDEQLVADTVAQVGTDLQWHSRVLGGYGLAILERGEGEHKRALSLYFGDASGGHGHYDRLNIEMKAFGHSVLCEDGYPTPFTRPDFHEWRRANTARHYLVQVDEEPHRNTLAGDLNTLAVAPEVQVVDASAEIAYEGKTPLYRRTAALVDVSPEASYLVDIFRVRGGRQHDWCFHGPPFPEFSLTGGTLGPVQTRGTLAGENVPYGARPPALSDPDSALIPLQTATGLLTGDHYSKLEPEGWTTHANGILTQKVGAEAVVALDSPFAAGPCKILARVWDYCDGANEVDLTLGGVTVTLTYETGDQAGFRWVSALADLPEPARELRVVARSRGQSHILVDQLVLTKRLDLDQPEGNLARTASSGYQGFWNVQRMHPAGLWSATWRQPDEDVSLTMTMPAGCTQEVVSCLGEPELVPGAPKTLQYVIGRNRGSDLLSRYVAVVEPHKGPATVTDVVLLRSADAPAEAVGLRVSRGGVTDLIHSSLDREQLISWEGAGVPFAAQGEYALVTLGPDGVQRACLINGTRLQAGAITVESAPPPTGRVVAVDHGANTITLDQPLANAGAFRDTAIILGNERHSTSYMVVQAEVRDGHTIIGLGDVLCIVGMGAVQEFDPTGDVLLADRRFDTYGRTEHDRHAGRWVFNENKTRCFRLAAIEQAQRLRLEGAAGDLAEVFADADGDGRRVYWISDIGPGDTWRLPSVTWLQRQASGTYAVQAAVQVKLTLPKGE
ncbi:MAG: hypothetical protein HPY69_05825 [Armatimonadetes bacterium]|nr:hypothetical protein [Armatimonadota bacterium]